MEVCADGSDVTEAFVAGARRALAEAGEPGMAILKARSPSCIDGSVAPGGGVFAALLRQRGVALRSEEDLVAASASGTHTHTTGE